MRTFLLNSSNHFYCRIHIAAKIIRMVANTLVDVWPAVFFPVALILTTVKKVFQKLKTRKLI